MRTGRSLKRRVIEKIEIEPRGHGTPCWIWTAALNAKGYGCIRVNRRTRLAHRIAYELLVSPIPEGMQLDHLCRIPACVNPDHLEPVTRQENLDRGIHANRSKTHCPQGHAYDTRTRRGRRCSICLREQRRAYKQRKRAAA